MYHELSALLLRSFDLAAPAVLGRNLLAKTNGDEKNPTTDYVINTGGAAIRVEESGDGEPALIFLHYWGGSSRTWRSVIRGLGGTSRCRPRMVNGSIGDEPASDTPVLRTRQFPRSEVRALVRLPQCGQSGPDALSQRRLRALGTWSMELS